MRDYTTMCGVLAVAARARGELCYADFTCAGLDADLRAELPRLVADGLIDGDVLLDPGR